MTYDTYIIDFFAHVWSKLRTPPCLEQTAHDTDTLEILPMAAHRPSLFLEQAAHAAGAEQPRHLFAVHVLLERRLFDGTEQVLQALFLPEVSDGQVRKPFLRLLLEEVNALSVEEFFREA